MMVQRQRSHASAADLLETKHVDLSNPFPNDSSCFYGGDAAGNAFIARLAFRGPRRQPECWFDFQPAGGTRFGLPANPGPEREGFALGEVSFRCEAPGKRWRVCYRGPLTDAAGAVTDGTVELAFEGTHPLYDYAHSSDRRLIAAAIARERWTRAFFAQLRDLAQVHYEQFGRLRGQVSFGAERREVDLLAVRDHSYGSRDWTTWDRHYWISGLTADGTGFTAVAIRYDFCGPLYAGFTTGPGQESDAIVECTRLEELAASEDWPKQGVVELKMRSGSRHRLEFSREGVFPYVMDGAYLMKEGIGSYRFDGKPAYGLCEFGFKKEKYAHLVA
jgi:hypothetical protein